MLPGCNAKDAGAEPPACQPCMRSTLINRTAEKRLVVIKQHLVNLENIVLAVDNEILHNYVELAAVLKCHAGFKQKFTSLVNRKFQSYCKGESIVLLGLVVPAAFDF